MLAAVCVVPATAALGDTLRAQDVAALAVALTHAGNVIGVGPMLVATDTVEERIVPPEPGARMADPAQVRAAARAAGLAEGTSRDAIACAPNGGCRAAGVFRAMVQVLEYREPASDRFVVMLQIVEVAVEGDTVVAMYIRIDEVHVDRTSRESAWRMGRVRTITES
jgi:hypothetical protein